MLQYQNKIEGVQVLDTKLYQVSPGLPISYFSYVMEKKFLCCQSTAILGIWSSMVKHNLNQYIVTDVLASLTSKYWEDHKGQNIIVL